MKRRKGEEEKRGNNLPFPLFSPSPFLLFYNSNPEQVTVWFLLCRVRVSMTLEQFHALQRDDGKALLSALAHEALAEDDLLPVLERYRKTYPAELVNAALELSRLRRRAAGKFSRAGEMFFSRDALEMASSETVAQYTARRFAGLSRVMDLCCGIGGDALALVGTAGRVIAVERDPLALEMARANARALALHDLIDFVQADVTELLSQGMPLVGRLDAIFIDPSRRESRAAARRAEEYSPPLSWCLGLRALAPRVAIKVSPALDYEQALAGVEAEVEIISLRGECKEAVYWLGAFRGCAQRATVLPAGATLSDDGPTSEAISAVGGWLYEPDGAVIRAHLVQRLAGEHGLRRIDAEIAYLSGDAAIEFPLLHGYRVQAVIPWGLKRLNAELRARGIGHVVIKKRGFPLTPEQLQPKLKLPGPARATLICTRAMGDTVVIICE